MTTIRRPKGSIRRGSSMIRILRAFIGFCFCITVLLLSVLFLIPDSDDKIASSNELSSSIEDLDAESALPLINISDIESDTAAGGIVEQFGGVDQLKNTIRRRIQPKLQKFQLVFQHRRKEVQEALKTLTEGNIPARLRALRERHEIVGERLQEIRYGIETVHEIIHGQDLSNHHDMLDRPAMPIQDIVLFLKDWIFRVRDELWEVKHSATPEDLWQKYHDFVTKNLYPHDRDYLVRMPPRRTDGSIFLSVVSFRDGLSCNATLHNAYANAKHPEKLYIGLVQQICYQDCKIGLIKSNSTTSNTLKGVPPDSDCYKEFCATALGKPICDNNSKGNLIRVLNIDESESLGPYMARYFASKLWNGEQWFMHVDAKMTFVRYWDTVISEMMHKVPTPKAVISHTPPLENDFKARAESPSRLCMPSFATSDIEEQIVRIDGPLTNDRETLSIPTFAPFASSEFFVAHSDILRDVPLDPFLPWIDMGQEIVFSSRMWTAGYDIYSPSQLVVLRLASSTGSDQPKYEDFLQREFVSTNMYKQLQRLVLQRVKYQLGYPESARDMIYTKSILTAIEQYSMGVSASLDEYLQIVGLNMTTKEVTRIEWCEKGYPPPGMERFDLMYPGSKLKSLLNSSSS